ncbi:hypothetical protein Pint_04901 [Pistacia integerrima]|uniref:Uncharacterized protein n=1 Tax=Pistacia integerrima TaxID=434235 RepID=A0ACC0Z5E7_9ROSI|nr:hypothetical protein Pint_04901 [Pistacia integerrima]
MDAIVSLADSETREVSLGPVASGCEDRISRLPEDVLLYILSHLPIKDVLRTSALSKRWKYLWTSVSEIDFNEYNHELRLDMKTSFLDSVDNVLLRHDPSDIRKFRLELMMLIIAERINSWVSAAVSHNVQELDLSLPVKKHFVLHYSLFTSESISILKLRMGSYFKFPCLIRLSNLKTLHLAVTFPDDRSTERFFSGCPVLEELVLDNCVWDHNKSITLCIPTLRALTIYNGPFSPDGLLDCVIIVHAENLTSFRYTSCLAIGLLPCNLTSLESAYVDAYVDITYLEHTEDQFPRRAISLLSRIHNVKSLTLSTDTMECLYLEEYLQAGLPTFSSLTHLKVNFGESQYLSDQLLMCLLEKSPNIESLEIPEVFYPDSDRLSTAVPQCFNTRLKTVVISNIDGDDVGELWFLKYMLENATVLERVKIFCVDSEIELVKQEINQQLQPIHIRSKSCVIEFCDESNQEPDIFP